MKKYLNRKTFKTLGVAALGLGSVLMLSEQASANLEAQLTKVDTLFQGKILKTGLTAGTVIGAIAAMVQRSIAGVMIVIGIGLALSFYLGWIRSDNFIQAIQ